MKKIVSYLFMVLLGLLPLSVVSCSSDDDDFGGGNSSDFIELTLNGKTYREKIPAWGYVILDGTETDSEGRRITITNVAVDVFEEKYGFSFLPSISHFSKKADLLAAKPGTYLHKNRFGNAWEGEFTCENLTLVSGLDVFESGAYYELMEGTHRVVSIKGVGENVRVEGTFEGTYYSDRDGRQCEIQGKYRMTLDVHDSVSPFD